MSKARVSLTVVAIVLVFIIYKLPKVVVENDVRDPADSVTTVNPGTSDPSTENNSHQNLTHSGEIPESTLNLIVRLREKFNNSVEIEKSTIFADSLENLFQSVNRYDSAAWYMASFAERFPERDNWLKAGESYYKAFTFAVNIAEQQRLAESARSYFDKVLEIEPGNSEVKAKVAMTYVSSTSPMKGITMLREILAEDPKNETALYNLGILSMQSGQFDKAQVRFENLVKYYPQNLLGQFYLGVSYFEQEKFKKAQEQFENLLKITDDPAVNAKVQEYLEKIN
ncbi:tetratricopeptide repeat protein [Fulvivirgaceae bacterium BMA10]|uniref:Tetratricopeptide repeat protein n=1 Tax=Splendidivirga corallicola TaxID=3051826 RepID=A0ABT8KUE8_9BACT|nr:tetratricopeptide repeat protein [Fulvivirgaceae bacterium BMA10]